MGKRFSVLLLLAFGVSCGSVAAANPPGTITLAVDATDAPRNLIHARLTIPVTPGPFTLLYPEWIPGEHGPVGPITNLSALKITAGGRALAWRRDDVDMFAFHVDVPQGISALEVSLDNLGQLAEKGFSSSASATAALVMVSWNQCLLYPAGSAVHDFTYAASLRLPAGWKFATALDVASHNGDTLEFKPVPLDVLVDSPVLSGANFKVVPLAPEISPAHHLDLAADSEAALEIPGNVVAEYSQLVRETGALFGARHYGHYDFLVSLSDHVAHFGLEHHQSSDDRMRERAYVDGYLYAGGADLLTHEFTHSWNGKFRRPAGLATTDYREPMKGELLWVYEGLTEYLGVVLAARTGLRTPEQFRQDLARSTAEIEYNTGRAFMPLLDTAVAAQILYDAPDEWKSRRRDTDFYYEGTLIWMDVDTTIRDLTKGQKSLDDFCRAFFAGGDHGPEVKSYTFDDVVNTLTQVVAHDWRQFLNSRVNAVAPHVPMRGIERGGWKLVFIDTPNSVFKGYEVVEHLTDVRYSLGLLIREPEQTLLDVWENSPAWKAGLGPGMKLLAVNGRSYTPTVLHDAIREAVRGPKSIQLSVQNGSFVSTFEVNYHGGEKFPDLERIPNVPDLLGEIIKPLAPAGK